MSNELIYSCLLVILPPNTQSLTCLLWDFLAYSLLKIKGCRPTGIPGFRSQTIMIIIYFKTFH